jgi:predicted DNA-binding protein with PD1-like motif
MAQPQLPGTSSLDEGYDMADRSPGSPAADLNEEAVVKKTRIDNGDAPTFVLVGDPDDDAVAELSRFARDEHITAAQLTAIGGFRRATVGWFDRDRKDYGRIEIDQQCEVLSLVGDIADGPDGPQVHAHAVLGLCDGTVRGGHLLGGKVYPTLEIIVRQSPGHLRKTSHPDLGLALIDLDRSADVTT